MTGPRPAVRAAAAFRILTLAMGAVLFLTWAWPLRERALAGRNDFLQLYAGARLVGTPELYSIEASKRIHREVTGTWYPSVYYTRLPFYALMLKPLAWLPYTAAYWTFQAISVSFFLLFLWLYGRAWPDLALLVSLSVPVLINFINGQDAGIVTALAGLALVLVRRGRDFPAGLLLALCAIKIHLFVLVPVALLLHRRWRILQGGLAGGALLLAASFLAAGVDWPLRFLAMVGNPELHPGPDHTPTLRGLVWVLAGENAALEAALAAMVVALFVHRASRIRDFEVVFALSLVAGLLVCHHAYVQDCTVLVLAAALVATARVSKLLLGLMIVATLPPAYFLLFHGAPYNAAVPLLLGSILVAASGAAHDRPDRAPAGLPAP